MQLASLRLCLAVLSLLLLPAASLRAETEKSEQVGTFRFALRDLPPLLQPVQGTHSYLVNGKNANWYDDNGFPNGTVRAEVNYLGAGKAAGPSVETTTYKVIRVTEKPSGNPPGGRRHCHLEGEKFRINLYFASGDADRIPSKADLRKAFGRHIVFEGEETR